MQAATPLPPVRVADTGASRREHASGAQTASPGVRALGALGLIGVVTSVFVIDAGAASAPSQYVPGRSGGWPVWMSGPFRGLHVGLGSTSFQTWTLVMCACYALVLAIAGRLSKTALWCAIAAAHAVLLFGPPLISQDVFGYLAFARLGALHGLDPYTHFAAEAPTDHVYVFVGWPFQHSPYGPLFTLASYALAPFGLATGLWALKAVAVASSLTAIALIARAAERAGHSPTWAAAFVGLNPVLLILAVGGAHNDTLVMLALAVALVFTAGSSPRLRAGAIALGVGVGVKITAGLAIPFLVTSSQARRQRLAVALSAVAGLVAVAVVGLIGFGEHALGFIDAVGEQQQLVATHSIPAETARLAGLTGTPTWWRHVFLAAFALVLCFALWRTWRGSDWRVASGWTTIALLLSTAWLLPWYAIWALPLAAVSGNRRLRAATLVLCAYAVLIHLQLADPVLSPAKARVVAYPRVAVPGVRHRLKLAGFQILDDVKLDLRW